MTREMTCVTCPIGCRLTAERAESGEIRVGGNKCDRGRVYAEAELTSPKRVLTLCLRAGAGGTAMLPCKTAAPFPKELIPELIAELRKLRVALPAALGDVVLADALGTGIDVVATRSLGAPPVAPNGARYTA